MSTEIRNPHDKFFKETFSHSDAAHDFIRYYLPADIVAVLDLSHLEIRKDSFIDPELREYFSDVLYTVALKSGQPAHIYVLFEHKSYPDPLVAFQVLRYMVRIWEQATKQNEALVPILPLVFYHGLEPWTISQQFADLLNVPDVLKAYVPDYRYWLCDIGAYTDVELKAEIQQAVILQTGLLALKYIYAEDVTAQLRDMAGLMQALAQQETGRDYLLTLLRYMSTTAPHLDKQEFQSIVQHLLEKGDKLMATVAEQWLEEGREEGREQGREVTLKVLQRYLATRFNLALDHFDAVLSTLDLPTLNQLSDAAFEAENLADFEAALQTLTTADSGDESTKPTSDALTHPSQG